MFVPNFYIACLYKVLRHLIGLHGYSKFQLHSKSGWCFRSGNVSTGVLDLSVVVSHTQYVPSPSTH